MTCLDILLSKYTSRKLSQLGLLVRERDNQYAVHSFAVKLLTDKMMSLDDFAQLEPTVSMLDNLGHSSNVELFKQYLDTFENPEAQIMARPIYQYTRSVQDYILTKVLSEKSIDKLASNSQSDMWTGEHYVETLHMLFRNGLMSFDKKKTTFGDK